MAESSGLDSKLTTVQDMTEMPPAPIPSPTHPSHITPWGAVRLSIQRLPVRDEYLVGGLIVLAILVSLGIFFLRDVLFDAVNLSSLGYAGVFVFTLLGSATIFLPSGGGAAIILAGAVLNPITVGVLAGIAGAMGELTGYLIGYHGGMVLEKHGNWYSRAQRWMKKRGSLTIFILATVPNPIFDIAGLAAGGMRFPLKKFITLVWVGKTLQATAGALIGFWGSEQLISLAESITG